MSTIWSAEYGPPGSYAVSTRSLTASNIMAIGHLLYNPFVRQFHVFLLAAEE